MIHPTIEYDRSTSAWERCFSATITLDPSTVTVAEAAVVEVPLSALERLVSRSARPDGFDRDALLNLDTEAWGTAD